jgi:hypothetical protein
MMKMSAWLSDLNRRNAIDLPSGDQVGWSSMAGSVVSRMGSPGPTSLM